MVYLVPGLNRVWYYEVLGCLSFMSHSKGRILGSYGLNLSMNLYRLTSGENKTKQKIYSRPGSLNYSERVSID